MNSPLCQPIRFRPLYQDYFWGGDQLQKLLGKSPEAGQKIAESWEIVDLPDYQSQVTDGPWEGMTLNQLVTSHGSSLLGVDSPQESFPLIFKFLDCQHNLSIQVHPDDRLAARLDPPGRGKTEAWVVLEAKPQSRIYAGLKPGVEPGAFETALELGNVESVMHWIEPQVGDCLLVPAGTVHALGAGLVVAEIQQASDTTYRLFDWNRIGSNGKPRELHLEAGLEAVDFQSGPRLPQDSTVGDTAPLENLVSCPSFVLDRITTDSPVTIGGDDHCRILSVLAGEVEVGGAQPLVLGKGETCLLPAAAGRQRLTPGMPSIVLSARQP